MSHGALEAAMLAVAALPATDTSRGAPLYKHRRGWRLFPEPRVPVSEADHARVAAATAKRERRRLRNLGGAA